ncbi:MAG: hypothetical protein RR246_06215, partial [Clostridia bacterium]
LFHLQVGHLEISHLTVHNLFAHALYSFHLYQHSVLVLLFLQFITSEGAFDYIIPLMAVIGAIAAFLLAGKAKPRKKNIKNHTKKHKIK